MPHQQLHDVCRKIAENETRFLIIQEEYKDLPKGEYGFVELYCIDSKCDCRNVYIQMINPEHTEPLATISYGWERLKFYEGWMGSKSEDVIHSFKGPALTLGRHSNYAPTLLELFTEVIIEDDSYVERLKKHYKLFKNEINKRARSKIQPIQEAKIGRNDLCICGSGRKYKNCCG